MSLICHSYSVVDTHISLAVFTLQMSKCFCACWLVVMNVHEIYRRLQEQSTR